jgi:hypothetical protein
MADDLDKARDIVRRRRPFVGAMGTLEENIAMAVAEGIAIGRKEGLEKAGKIAETEIGTAKK